MTSQNSANTQVFDRLLSDIIDLHGASKLPVVGIDGPTASGKTTLALALKEALEARNIPVCIYHVDWALSPRTDRTEDLAHLRQRNETFEHEASLHMRMEIVDDFLRRLRAFRESDANSESITLEGLYSREHDGRLEGTAEFTITPDTVVLVEGHYTLLSRLDMMMDLNVLLLATFQCLLDRKVERVKSYRSPDETIDYFWRIDAPSFQEHLRHHGCYADYIVDTTDVENFTFQNFDAIQQWIHNSSEIPDRLDAIDALNFTDIGDVVFSRSLQVPHTIRDGLNAMLKAIKRWDTQVGTYLRTSIINIEKDLTDFTRDLVAELNQDHASHDLSFEFSYSDALYNVYHRKLPLSLGISLYEKQERKLAVLADVHQSSCNILIFWEGGYKRFQVHRQLGSIESSELEYRLDKHDINLFDPRIIVYTPTDLTLPPFLDGVPCNPVFIGREEENVPASQIVQRLLEHGGVWVHRFALFSERRFFKFILDSIGAEYVSAGNYLISIRHSNSQINSQFLRFLKEWQSPIKKANLVRESHDALDQYVLDERHAMKRFVESNTEHFSIKDDSLFSQFMVGKPDTVDAAIKELRTLLSSPIRLLRKRATQFVLEYFPNLSLPTQNVWRSLPPSAPKKIHLDAYNRLSPSIMAEIYLWLSLRNQPGAILGANIYDIRENSADCTGHLQAAHSHSTGIVLQSSLNAVGQPETCEDGSVKEGYLKPQHGVRTFIDSCLNAARNFYFETGEEPPLYSIGLDHVNSENDTPSGRSKRFLNEALATQALTHAVLDGSALFDAKSQDEEELSRAYGKLAQYAADLVDSPSDMMLIDRELCAGELSYIGNSTTPHIPSTSELQLFVDQYQQAVAAKGHLGLLARPMLFIGNLGTTHHGEDTSPPQVGNAVTWKHGLKKEGFVSSVLHGTTGTMRQVLKDASAGCHKINVAGDFLFSLIRHLPQPLATDVQGSEGSPKTRLADIRDRMDDLEPAQQTALSTGIQATSSEIMDAIQTPKLTPMDKRFFKYMSFAYSDSALDAICSEIKSRIATFHALDSSGELAEKHFSSSMIEVPLDKMQSLVPHLVESGIQYFHIDAGDGEFISRSFSGVEKAEFVKQHFPDIPLHAHLMVKNAHRSRGGLSVIEAYARAGCDRIGLHLRAFDSQTEFKAALAHIRELGKEPGIVIEVHDVVHDDLLSLITSEKIHWVVVMGVPIGYGGQIFQFSSLNTLRALRTFSTLHQHPLLIESDGGLTLDNLHLCKNAGADIFAGWSIIKSDSLDTIRTNIHNVYKVLKGES
jgi:ribulose-phosphate 3-epimerase